MKWIYFIIFFILLLSFFILNTQTENCNTSINISLLGYELDTSIPFFEVYLGDLSCNSINRIRWVFELEDNSGIYKITGLKLWILLLPVFILLILNIATSNNILNKAIQKYQ